MKKIILCALFLALLLICAVLASACDGGGEKPTSTNAETDNVASPPKDNAITKEEAKIEALRILTPRATDKAPIMDGQVHYHINGNGRKIICNILEETLGKNAKPNIRYAGLGQLYLMRCTEGNDGTPETMCNIEGCKHNDITCPAIVRSNGLVLPVTDEKTGRTVVYTDLNVNVKSIPVLGKSVDLSKEFGFPENITVSQEHELHVLFEYDMETGERRAVTIANFLKEAMTLDACEYYNGRLYFCLNSRLIESQDYYDHHCRILYVDVSSGELKYCEEPDGEQSFLYFIRIRDEKIYCISEKGELIKMNLDFGEREVISKIENFATELTFENGAGTYFGISSNRVALDNGYLYIETLDSELLDRVLYKIPLSGEGEPEMIPDKLVADFGFYKENEMAGIDYFDYTFPYDGFILPPPGFDLPSE